MIAAIYARKSTDQNIADEEKSVARQIESARAFAVRHGWEVCEDYVYVDDGVSGAEFVKREGLTHLMAAVRGKPRPFDVLVIMDESRLGREQIETSYLLRQITDAGVRVFAYLTGQERKLDSAMDKVLLSLTNFAAEVEREQAKVRTRAALLAKAAKGYVAGGKVLGYRNVAVMVGDRRSHVRREIDPEQAAIVRRIFTLCAEGQGLLRIAKTLNAEGIRNPTGHDRTGAKRAAQWSATGVREVLHRDLYQGRVIYGKTRWVDRGGTKVKEDRPESDWLVLEVPELRTVSEELWQAVQARLAGTRDAHRRRASGGKPDTGLESRYLLSGFLRCGVCGGNLIISKKSAKRGRPQTAYVCTTRRTRGDEGCTNKHGVPATVLTDAVLARLKHVFLNPVALGDLLLAEFEERRKMPAEREVKRRDLTESIAKVESELGRLADSIACGSAAPQTILQAIQTREAEHRDLKAKLEHLEGLAIEAGEFDLNAWLDETRDLLENVRETLEADPASGRQVLRGLLVARSR